MTLRKILPASALLVLAVAIVLLRANAPTVPASDGAARPSAAESAHNTDRAALPVAEPLATVRAVAEASAPLPPPEAAFDLVVDGLVARAERGEAGAACRLAL